MPPTTPSPSPSPSTTPRPRGTLAWAAALVVLPIVTAIVSIASRREELADAVLPAADGPVPLELVGALWVVLPVMVALALLVTVRRDGAPRWGARALALLAAAWIGTIPFFLRPAGTDAGFAARTFGAATPRVASVEDGIFFGILGVVGAIVLTVVVLVVAYRRPADFDEWTPEAREARNRAMWVRLGLVLLGLLVVALTVIAVVVT